MKSIPFSRLDTAIVDAEDLVRPLGGDLGDDELGGGGVDDPVEVGVDVAVVVHRAAVVDRAVGAVVGLRDLVRRGRGQRGRGQRGQGRYNEV